MLRIVSCMFFYYIKNLSKFMINRFLTLKIYIMKTKQTDYYSKGDETLKNHSAIKDLLRIKPILFEVCKWEIDSVTGKPVKTCWITEPVNAPV